MRISEWSDYININRLSDWRIHKKNVMHSVISEPTLDKCCNQINKEKPIKVQKQQKYDFSSSSRLGYKWRITLVLVWFSS